MLASVDAASNDLVDIRFLSPSKNAYAGKVMLNPASTKRTPTRDDTDVASCPAFFCSIFSCIQAPFCDRQHGLPACQQRNGGHFTARGGSPVVASGRCNASTVLLTSYMVLSSFAT